MKLITHRITAPLLLAGSLFVSLPATAAIEMLDRIVAIVDDSAVTQTELDERVSEIIQRAQSSGVSLPPQSVIQEQTLNLLINEKLQLNAAKRFGVNPTDREVADAIDRILKSQKITEETFKKGLQQSGLSYDRYRKSIKKQLTMQQVSRGVVGSRIKISEQDVDSFLKSADAKSWSSVEYNIGHIFIPVPQSADFEASQAAEKSTNELYQTLLDGKNFEATAIANSKGPNALKGGDLGWRKSSALPTAFAKVVPDLLEGQIAEPIRSQAGYHILKLKAKRGEDKQVIMQTNVSHILLTPNEILSSVEAEEKLKQIRLDVINGKAEFADMAKEHTEDIGTKLSGGNMGWSSPGMFVPEFEQKMEQTAIGSISQPFQTQFGWHILRVEDRRQEDVTEEVLRNRARGVLRNRRVEDELQLWVQEMRDNAFIDIKI